MIKTVIAEDQSLLRGALATLLSLENDIEVLAQTEDGKQALDAVIKLRPDVLVTDIEMPLMSGIELAQEINARKLGTKILVVTTFARPGYLERARKAGVSGYVLKDAPSEDLAQSLRRVAAGEVVIDAALAESAWASSDPLTDRERAILRLAEAGQTNKQIAKKLHLSAGTVRNYLAEATQKLGAANRIEASRKARENGWL